eukprot:6745158-Prymnesium_polylepis.1
MRIRTVSCPVGVNVWSPSAAGESPPPSVSVATLAAASAAAFAFAPAPAFGSVAGTWSPTHTTSESSPRTME